MTEYTCGYKPFALTKEVFALTQSHFSGKSGVCSKKYVLHTAHDILFWQVGSWLDQHDGISALKKSAEDTGLLMNLISFSNPVMRNDALYKIKVLSPCSPQGVTLYRAESRMISNQRSEVYPLRDGLHKKKKNLSSVYGSMRPKPVPKDKLTRT